MRYHFVKPQLYNPRYGIIYECNHEVYSKCTLYLIKDKGLAVIQQRYDKETKTTWWTEIDPYLVDALYLNQNFEEYFNRYSGIVKGKLYPTVTIRQIMWALKMKPIKENDGRQHLTIEIFDSEENIHHCENINKMEVEKEMNLIKSIIGMFDVSDFKLIKKRKKKEKPSTVKDLINNPDQYKLEMFVENNEIVVKIRKREEES